mgnify:CR=1 FL=1
MILNTGSMDHIGRALGASALRQNVIANNIANVETPKFKRSEVRFEELLKQELNAYKSTFVGYRTDPRHLPIGGASGRGQVRPEIVTDHTTSMNNNENNVDIDYEMAQMAKNQIYYSTLIQNLNGQIQKLRTVINGKG